MKPSYLRISEQLDQYIKDGIFKKGEKLPSEIEMASNFGVSRETFRSAVKVLEREGKLFVKHGAGTFVVNPLPNIENNIETLQSITDMIQSAGLKEGEKRESISLEPCNQEWADKLCLSEGTPVIVNKRTRMAEDVPVVVSINIIPEQFVGEEFIQQEELGSLFQYFEEQRGIYISRTDVELNVPLHTDRNCQKLLVYPETTVLMLKQLHYDILNEPLMYSMDYFRTDVFTFTMRRARG
ncbi:GntR family transcriptional regulator [Bacillaceae bacterium SIJ1]|uniref:GntR family transcriptional regulator n=1 Tax=Litoribacterium kuwaitense TaxID=1398745 RepID=UPI0013EDF7A7|nr:GntR family transcriptional regulator [Litoribacterium kuwaitense]NGP45539.1 GntR family transcriptional regulator [Litoribacterium kuwaitense]